MTPWRGIARFCVALASLLPISAPLADPIDLDTNPIALVPTNPRMETVGALAYRGGLNLTSDDARFGGLSGLVVGADGVRLTAVTDTGHWFEARLSYDSDGRLATVTDASMIPLLDETGAPLTGKRETDSESLTLAPSGEYLVSFERHHRILRYTGPGATAQPVDFGITNMSGIANNGGLEAVEFLADGRLLLLTEDHFVSDGRLAGWLVDGNSVETLTYPGNGYFKPTDLARLPDGRLLVLERGYSAIGGPKGRIMLIEPPSGAGAIPDPIELARLQPPIQVDNYEGLAVRTANSGETLLYMVSDDNFNGLQRTLLLMFALAE